MSRLRILAAAVATSGALLVAGCGGGGDDTTGGGPQEVISALPGVESVSIDGANASVTLADDVDGDRAHRIAMDGYRALRDAGQADPGLELTHMGRSSRLTVDVSREVTDADRPAFLNIVDASTDANVESTTFTVADPSNVQMTTKDLQTSAYAATAKEIVDVVPDWKIEGPGLTLEMKSPNPDNIRGWVRNVRDAMDSEGMDPKGTWNVTLTGTGSTTFVYLKGVADDAKPGDLSEPSETAVKGMLLAAKEYGATDRFTVLSEKGTELATGTPGASTTADAAWKSWFETTSKPYAP